MSGASAVVALVLVQWTGGWIAAAAWSQSWGEIKRGHFRITAWITAVLGVLAFLADRAAVGGLGERAALQRGTVLALVVVAIAYLAVQYSRTDVPAVVVGAVGGVVGVAALVFSSGLLKGWPVLLATVHLIGGMVLLGAVMNGMMLGHWYLNQPGLKPAALARLTKLALGAAAFSFAMGALTAAKLAGAPTEDAVLGLPGFGASFGLVFFVSWLVLLAFTAAVLWAAWRCVKIRSIQSATGLFYVAVLSAGVAEFIVRYLMVNAV